MENPGAYSLDDFTIGAAASQVGCVIDELDGCIGATFQATFAPEGGEGAVAVYLATSIDQGTRWCDIAVLRFSEAGTLLVNVSAEESTPTPITPTDGTLDDDSSTVIVDGILGDRLRARVISTGTFTGSSLLSARVVVR